MKGLISRIFRHLNATSAHLWRVCECLYSLIACCALVCPSNLWIICIWSLTFRSIVHASGGRAFRLFWYCTRRRNKHVLSCMSISSPLAPSSFLPIFLFISFILLFFFALHFLPSPLSFSCYLSLCPSITPQLYSITVERVFWPAKRDSRHAYVLMTFWNRFLVRE